MKITFTSTGDNWDSQMDKRFGRAKYFLTWDDSNESFSIYDNSVNALEEHGAGPKASQALMEIKPDVLITGNGPGGNADVILKKFNIDIYIGAGEMNIKNAYNAFKNNKLKKF